MLLREQLQLVTGQKLALNCFHFHCRLGGRWGFLCQESISYISYNFYEILSLRALVDDVCLLGENVSIWFPVVNIILLMCTDLKFLPNQKYKYLRNSVVQLKTVTDLYSFILKSPNPRVIWGSKVCEGRLSLKTELIIAVTWLLIRVLVNS